MNTENIVARLRKSHKILKVYESGKGYALGEDWASTTAEYWDLVWLEQSGDAEALHKWRIDDSLLGGFFTCGSEFWDSAIGSPEIPSLALTEGFVEGALAVWRDVQDRVCN